jgi:hypothetical protein
MNLPKYISQRSEDQFICSDPAEHGPEAPIRYANCDVHNCASGSSCWECEKSCEAYKQFLKTHNCMDNQPNPDPIYILDSPDAP